MRIDPARPEDAVALTAIAHAAKRHWGYPEEWIARWSGLLTITPEYLATHPVLVAVMAGRVVGFCALALAAGEGGRPATAQLDHLWVLPDAMGQGVGRALFNAAEIHARSSGAARLWLEGDPHAEGFYLRMGMVRFGAVPAPMDGQARELPLMEKLL
jgi:GNAT superfamily N-acetyltransferase